MKATSVAAFLVAFALQSSTFATWSIVAADLKTHQVAIASATCVRQGDFKGFPAKGLMDIQAIVVPGVGIAAAQADVDSTRANHKLIFEQLKKGTPPADILELLKDDAAFELRQFGIIDLKGRAAAATGKETGTVAVDMFERVEGTDFVFSVQGNILASDEVVYQAARAFRESKGGLTERLMAAMEAADAQGGDRRCTCATPPPTAASADCVHKTAHVAYLLVANADDASGESFNDGKYFLFLDVTDVNIQPEEDANPVKTLRMRYDAWAKSQRDQ